jgi:hypothetical protein
MDRTKTYRSKDLVKALAEVLEKERETGPDRGWRMLPIVTYERKKWFFDERLRQIRNVKNPHDFMDLNDFEIEYFKRKAGKKM